MWRVDGMSVRPLAGRAPPYGTCHATLWNMLRYDSISAIYLYAPKVNYILHVLAAFTLHNTQILDKK